MRSVCVASGSGEGCTAFRLHAELIMSGEYVASGAGIGTVFVGGGILTARRLSG